MIRGRAVDRLSSTNTRDHNGTEAAGSTKAKSAHRTAIKSDDGAAAGAPVAESATVLRVDDFLHASITVQHGVQAAIEAAVQSARATPTTLAFSRREYRLASPHATAHTPVLRIADASGGCALHVDGQGATLVVTTPMAGLFSIQNTSTLSVSNLTVDYDPLPMTQGFVTAVQSPTRYTVQLEKGFPSLMSPQFMATIGGGWGDDGAAWVIVKDSARPTVHKNGTLNLIRVGGWRDRGDGLFNVELQLCSNCTACSGCKLTPKQRAAVGPAVGDPVVHLARFGGYRSTPQV